MQSKIKISTKTSPREFNQSIEGLWFKREPGRISKLRGREMQRGWDKLLFYQSLQRSLWSCERKKEFQGWNYFQKVFFFITDSCSPPDSNIRMQSWTCVQCSQILDNQSWWLVFSDQKSFWRSMWRIWQYNLSVSVLWPQYSKRSHLIYHL